MNRKARTFGTKLSANNMSNNIFNSLSKGLPQLKKKKSLLVRTQNKTSQVKKVLTNSTNIQQPVKNVSKPITMTTTTKSGLSISTTNTVGSVTTTTTTTTKRKPSKGKRQKSTTKSTKKIKTIPATSTSCIPTAPMATPAKAMVPPSPFPTTQSITATATTATTAATTTTTILVPPTPTTKTTIMQHQVMSTPAAIRMKPPSTAAKKFNQSVQHAKKLIVEAKMHAKSIETNDWTRAVELYTEAATLLPARIAIKLQTKIQNLQQRIAGVQDEELVKQHIQRAKQFIVQAKSKSKSLHFEEWSVAIELYSQARDLLPPHLTTKLSKKINTLTTKIAAAKEALKDSDDDSEDDDSADEVDLFSDAMFDLTDIFAWKKDELKDEEAKQKEEEAAAAAEEEEEEDDIAIISVGKTPMKQASALVFDRFGSCGAEIFALALGRSINLRVNTRNADELLEMLHAVDACETDILGTSDHALKVSWRKVAGRSRKRVHFCTFDLSTISPPDKWSDISDLKDVQGQKSAVSHSTNPQEKLTYHLCDVLTAAKELLCTKETAEDSNEALYKFLKGLREVADDKTVTNILRKGAQFFYSEFNKLKNGTVPFVDRFDKAATSSMRYHLRCLFNTKPDSITAKPITGKPVTEQSTKSITDDTKKKDSKENNKKEEDENQESEDDESDDSDDESEEEVDDDQEEEEEEDQDLIAMDKDGSYGYCGREDIAAIVHRALRERVGVINVQANEDIEDIDQNEEIETIDSQLVAMEASRFLYELLTHPGTIRTMHEKQSTWHSMKLLAEKIHSLSDVVPSFSLHSTVPLALNPELFVSDLEKEAVLHCRTTFDRLTTLDALAYSRMNSIKTSTKMKKSKSQKVRKKKKSEKRSDSELDSESDNYILNQAPFRFKYPKLNVRGKTDEFYGTVNNAALQDVGTKTFKEEAILLITKLYKTRRKALGGKIVRFFEKGMNSLKKSVKDETINDSTELKKMFFNVMKKNEKIKGSTKQREECRVVLKELFEIGYKKCVDAEVTTLFNLCRCEYCQKDASGGSDGSNDSENKLSCNICKRLVHQTCVMNCVENKSVREEQKIILQKNWFCRLCVNDALSDLKDEEASE